jgi:carbamate kinase
MDRVVVALGGNALLGRDEDATIENQRRHARESVAALDVLRARDCGLVVTHGNGPQVGSLLLEQEAVGGQYPLDVLVAETQAQIGYVLASELDAAVESRSAVLVTRVVVDEADPAFDRPTKPIGPFYDESETATLDFPTAAVTTPDGAEAFRRVVPSPVPERVVEADRIQTLVDDGATVICGGGGGIPMVESASGLTGVPAVVDKDHTSRLVAETVDARVLVMVTDVPCAYRDFGTDSQRPIRELCPAEAHALLRTGAFGPGSMAPKVTACARFVETTGGRAVICEEGNLPAALDGDAGTTIRPADR